MTKKEIDTILGFGNSCKFAIEGCPLGVTKFQAFLAIHHILTDKQYWYALRNAYDCSDNLYHYRHDVKLLFQSNRPFRNNLMTKLESNYLKRLPEQLVIYRGMTERELKQKSFGVSWTLKNEVAEFFANDYQRNFSTKQNPKTVHKIIINKSEVIAFLNGREEFEIIYIKDNDNQSKITTKEN